MEIYGSSHQIASFLLVKENMQAEEGALVI